MSRLRARLWRRELLTRLAEGGADDYESAEWLAELIAEEDSAQSMFQGAGVVFAQLSQVEAGVRELASRTTGHRSGRRVKARGAEVGARKPGSQARRSRSFHNNIKKLRSTYGDAYVKELKALEDVRHLRNHFAHGEIRVGMGSTAPDAPLEPVIALVVGEGGLPATVHESDPLQEVVEGDLDMQKAMQIAGAGLDALIAIMLGTGFSPYAESPEA